MRSCKIAQRLDGCLPCTACPYKVGRVIETKGGPFGNHRLKLTRLIPAIDIFTTLTTRTHHPKDTLTTGHDNMPARPASALLG